MMSFRLTSIALSVVVCSVMLFAQQQEAGTGDYALGNSSVMWIPRSTSLFLNPGELARLHQNEFLVSSSRFKSLNSMSGALFLPGAGTIGLGVAPTLDSTQYSLGFGRLIGGYHDVGAAFTVIPKVRAGFRFSFGGAIHVPTSVQNSGLHVGISVTNLPSKANVNAGVGYWVLPDIARIQLATRTHVERAEYVGAEVRIVDGLRIQAGTRGFKKVLGGMSYEMSYATAEFGAGPEGISFSMNVRISDAAADRHDEAYNEGDEAFVDGRFGDAKDAFLTALQYDEYDRASSLMVEKSQRMMDSLVTTLLQQAQHNEEKQDYGEAMKAYSQILKIDPQQSIAASSLADVEQKVSRYVQRLLAAGDSLKDLQKIDAARHSYELALELDPDNDSVSVRIDQLVTLSKENVRTMLSRAHTLLRKNQLDEAQKEFERALAADPGNSTAKSGLHTVASRRVNAQLSQAKTAYDSRRYFDALQMFLDVLSRDENNKEARQFLEKTRDALKSEIDKLFKTGLQFYIKEDFKAAIAEWDKVLMIVPSDSSTREYRKRAEEKLKALEQYQ